MILALVGRSAIELSLSVRIKELGIDWAYVLEAGQRHAVAPLLLERVLAISLSPAVRLLLEQEYRKVLIQTLHDNLVYRGELSRIVEALVTQGIQCVLFKGLSLDHSMLRPTGDIDLLVERPRLLDAIECIMSVLGYEYVEAFGNGTNRRRHTALSDILRQRITSQASWKHEFLTYNPKCGVLVELHVALFPSGTHRGTAVDPAASERVVQHISDGSQFNTEFGCRMPSPEHSMLIMCLQNSLKRSLANNRFRLGTLVDIARLAVCELRWEQFVRDCAELGLARHALFSLRLAQRLLDAPVPRDTLAKMSRACTALERLLVRLHLRCARSLDSSSWLYGTLYRALRPWSTPGTWGDRIMWVLGLALLLPSRERMATLLGTSAGSLLPLFRWLFNPIRWASEMLGSRLSRRRRRRALPGRTD